MLIAADAALPPSFRNHLAFLEKHRGAREPGGRGVWIRGPTAELTSWTPLESDAPIPADCRAIRLPPGWEGQWRERMVAAGFGPAERLAYMTLAKPLPPGATPPGVAIAAGRSEAHAEAFAAVQDAGFATGDPHEDGWWGPFFRRVARANRTDPAQTFYLASADGEPAATTLAVRAAGVVGVYAVATRPEQRNRGLAAALLRQVRADAGPEARIILQAAAGSYAHGYYARLGFETEYELAVWRRD